MTAASLDERARPGRSSCFAVVAAVFLFVTLIGGGSSASPLSAGLTRLCGVPVLALAVWRLAQRPVAKPAFWPLLILAAVVGLILVQLVPLPPHLWQALPGRRLPADIYASAGMAPPWTPISLTPRATVNAGLGLIPPAAMFCAVVTLGMRARAVLVGVVLSAAFASIVLGMLQLAGGPASPLRMYFPTSTDSAVGVFANRNHEAAFVALTLPLIAWLAGRAGSRRGSGALFWIGAAVAYTLVVAAAAAVTGSRAGALLVLLGCLGGVSVVWKLRATRSGGRDRRVSAPITALVAAAMLGVAFVATSGASVLGERLLTPFREDVRFEIYPTVISAGQRFAPVGSGVGSFEAVYQLFEAPRSMTHVIVNHAHNEYLETWMECGLPGVALIAAFLVWWISAGQRIGRGPGGPGCALALAGWTITAMLLLHSMVDYPLRTPGLATLFALACGLIVPPRDEVDIGSELA